MDELVVGTYEGFLLGYSVYTEESGKKLKQTFATHSHTASVRCVSISGKFLASGGTDDKVVVIDMKTRKEHTVLMNHDGTINTVAFTHSGSHLLTGSDDGSIIVTRTGNWQIEKIWKKAHGGSPVTAIAVHPSDKLALSIGGDKTLRTWNLIKGRPAFTINLASKGVHMPTEIMFSPGGDRFSLISQQMVDIWTISKAGLEKRISCNAKPTSVQWVSDERIFVGLENGHIITLTISDTQALTYQAHKQRVKCMHYDNETLYSISSSGVLKVWSVNDDILTEVCSANAGCRATCTSLNKQSLLIKKEETSIKENEPDTKLLNNDNEASSDENEEEYRLALVYDDSYETIPAKENKFQFIREPGAFVRISYGDEEEANETPQPPKKKFKRKNQNKKQKNKGTSQ